MKNLSKITIIFLILQISVFAQNIDYDLIDSKISNLELKLNELLIQMANLESDYSNKFEEMISEDKKLLSKLRSLNSKLRSNYQLIQSNNQDLSLAKQKLNEHSERIEKLNLLISDVEISYEVLNNAMRTNSERLDEMDDDIKYLELSYDIVHKEYQIMNNSLENQKARLDSIPSQFFCLDCLPKASLQMNWGLYPSNLAYARAKTSFEIGGSFRINRRLLVDVAYQRIGINTISEPILDQNPESILDKWNMSVFSAGMKFLVKDPAERKLNFEALFGAMYGFGSRDNFYNQQVVIREMVDNENYIGIYGGINIVYSEIMNKVPIEIVVGLRSFISFSEISFDSGVGDPLNIGNFMPSLNIGLRYSFDFN